MNNWLSEWAIVTLNTSNCMYDWWQHFNTFVVRVYCIQYVCLFIFCLNILKVYICLDNNIKRLNMDMTSPCMFNDLDIWRQDIRFKYIILKTFFF